MHLRPKKIGVLDLQGAAFEHLAMLNQIKHVKAIMIKHSHQLNELDGLIIPGGESTAISRLIKQNGLFDPIKQFAQQGKAIFGTCAGLVLCGTSTTHNEVDLLQLMDITVLRNGFGRQINSFETTLEVAGIGCDIPAAFIRAPYISEANQCVDKLAFVNQHCVMARQDNILVCAFHPELTQDKRIMQYFVDMC